MKDGGKAPQRGGNGEGPRHRLPKARALADGRLRLREPEPPDVPADQARTEAVAARMRPDESLARLAQGVAHDIGNLIAVIANSTASARQRLGASGAAAAPDLDQIDLAARMAGDISRQLLSLAGTGDEGAEPVDVAAVARDAVALLGPALDTGVELRLVAPGPAGASTVDLPRGQLEQVLVNLVLNARDALPGGAGTITVSVSVSPHGVAVANGAAGAASPAPRSAARAIGHAPRPTEVLLSAPASLGPGRHVVLAVGDDGLGMAPAVARRAAEPRFSTKPAGGHAGLGLATVVGIAERAGGEVHLRTARGAGTTVTVVLPASRAAVPSPM